MIYFQPSFITKKEANALIKLSLNGFAKAEVLGPDKDYRVAEYMTLKKDDPAVTDILKRLVSMIDISAEHFEEPQIIKYIVGGEYKRHHDFFHPKTYYYDEATKNGGQRVKSCLVYLNDDFQGGETEFPRHELVVKPEKGGLLFWDNVNPDKTLDFDSMHAGLPVTSGTKYIMVVWVRENVVCEEGLQSELLHN